MKKRYSSLDALRGFAIFSMILSGSIAFGDALPAWMYHAQVPPPNHQFNPLLPGITWVDLVFPFFIFCMGAAVPIAMNKIKESGSHSQVLLHSARRFLLLVFFALFLEHFKPFQISEIPSTNTYLLSIAGFVLLFFSIASFSKFVKAGVAKWIQYTALALSIALLVFLPLNNGNGFLLTRLDIIILVLANMAFFGTLCWWFTRNNCLLRLGLLPFIMAVFLASAIPGTWNEFVFTLTPEAAIYKFYFLKYLFIFIPGTLAGEWLQQQGDFEAQAVWKDKAYSLLALLLACLLVSNLVLLFSRELVINMIVTVTLLGCCWMLIKRTALFQNVLIKNFFLAGSYALLLGLFFEAYEGGIKKDRSTYSYYFVTSGLAFFGFLIIAALPKVFVGNRIFTFLSKTGQNPMMAYVLGSLLLVPLLQLTGVYPYWAAMDGNAFLGLLKGLLFTVAVCWITLPFTKKGFIWKT